MIGLVKRDFGLHYLSCFVVVILVAGLLLVFSVVPATATSAVVANTSDWALLFFTQPRHRPDLRDGGIVDRFRLFASMAQRTLDVAVYQIDHPEIVTAILQAKQHGVRVRVITDETYRSNAEVELLAAQGIPIITDLFDGGLNEIGESHNKFVVADGEYVWTGSFNFTRYAATRHEENVIILRNRPLAEAYTMEFNEMWGGSGPLPVASKSRIGADKTVKSQRDFTIMGYPARVLFSPGAGRGVSVDNELARLVASSRELVYVVQFIFTSREILDAMTEASERGVRIRGVMDFRNTGGASVFSRLRSRTGGVREEKSAGGGVIHHKLMILDPLGESPVLVIGSYNFTKKANEQNDENVLIIRNPDIVREAYNLCVERFGE